MHATFGRAAEFVEAFQHEALASNAASDVSRVK
jgi:hypothetical protein